MKERLWIKKAGIGFVAVALMMVLGMGCVNNKEIREHRAAAEAAMREAQKAAKRMEMAAERAEAAALRAEMAAEKCERTFQKGLRK